MNKIFYVGMCFWYLALGTEYGIIVPTLNAYITSIGAPEAYMGYCVGLYYLASLAVSIVFGRFVDRTQSLKWTYAIAISCGLLGYYIFTFYRTIGWIIFARIISGVNNGAYGAIIGRVALDAGENGGVLIGFCLLQREAGLILGSMVSGFWISSWDDFIFFGHQVDELNRYGFFIFIVWIVAGITGLVALRNEPSFDQKAEIMEEKIDEKNDEKKDEKIEFIQVGSLPFLAEPIIICLMSSFSIYFYQSMLEGTVGTIFRDYLGLNQGQIIIIFTVVGFTALLSYVISVVFSYKFHLKYALAFSQSLNLGTSSLFALMFFFGNFRDWFVGPGLAIGGFFVIFSIPPTIIASATIISDFSTSENKSTYQGMRCFVENMSAIFGPLWGANMIRLRSWVYAPIFVFQISTLYMTFSSWKRLDARKFKHNAKLNGKPEKLQLL
ncbi:Oidioi.mRNA.OKI2018_I69.chr2.g5130.t1.cds [Oikopleura dioica]|uniref:Oidioi.mRNA.OKI2018_I69.chr2.g5130.t1.cds n=1 Tax=Oikopleura dioica TaxID=34765 RepID=A0ABN7T142_OIKDI|nr:Oidioi.mRNA.OKI2018_I69.chr2.g5130.t1.cds [Oikopleura dioica]